MTAAELLAGLQSIPEARRVPAVAPIEAAVLLAGVEVAITAPAPDRTFRARWRERHGGGATPLLLLADDGASVGCVTVLGPIDGGALRTVDAGSLADLLRRIAGRSRLDAVRELAAELDRLDQAGIPGLKVRELLTLHTLADRVKTDIARWSALQDSAKAIPRGAEWRAALTALGYQVERRQHRGYLARFDGSPVAVVHPVNDPADFSRLDADGRPPEGKLLNDCRSDGAPFGLLASGGRLRLFDVDPQVGSAALGYVDLDTAALQTDDWPFLGLLGPQYLAGGLFEKLQAEARDFGAGLRKRLDQTIRQSVLPALGRGLGDWARAEGADVKRDEVREDFEQAALTLVFRAMFILYAEGARYLPMDNRTYEQHSLTRLIDEAVETADRLTDRSTSLWDRFALLVKAMRVSNTAWGVPAYNGALFALDGFAGAATLERASIADPDFAAVLVGIGRDPESGSGIDYSSLEISHLGHIYESLLSLRLSVADTDLAYDVRADRYVPPDAGQPADVVAGDLLWQTHEGGRKSGGVYYTRTELVRHLVRGSVVPAFGAHLERVRQLVVTDPAAAADDLFDFAVLDPACGSAHFLVVVVNELADMVVRFLGDTPLPLVRDALDRLRAGATAGAGIDDVALLRRLVLKRCVFGVDVSPMGAEVAKLSLWLASFVPGLSLAYLERNVVVGNSLVGVARAESLYGDGPPAFWDDALAEALASGAEAVKRVAISDDRNPDEYQQSEDADAAARAAMAGLQRLFDLWTAEPFGVKQARSSVALHGPAIIAGVGNGPVAEAEAQSREHRFLHWPLAFPQVFTRENPGFDAVIGNPPWEEVTVEELAFYGLFRPRLRSLPERARTQALAQLLAERPELEARLSAARERAACERTYFSAAEYEAMSGDPDLYKFFCQRYERVVRHHGVLGVVLPRSTFAAEGSDGFRKWLLEDTSCRRIDVLLNKGRWAFDSEPRYTVALVSAQRATPSDDHRVTVAGTATSLDEWHVQTAATGVRLERGAFGPGYTVPLLRSQAEADLLTKERTGRPFPYGASNRWRCFAVAELHETNDRRLWEGASSGEPLWKGESFEQFDPHGAGARLCPESAAVRKKIEKPKPGAGSLLAKELRLVQRRAAVLDEIDRARVAFRDVSRATDSRTVRSCLIPAGVRLTNKAPYLAFASGDDTARAACLAVMNSLPFDWQARRFVEINLNFFILEGLIVPDLSDEDLAAVADSAALLSCVDERFADFAASFGIEPGVLPDEERQRLRVEIDARVARAWKLTLDDLDVMFADFSLDAVPAEYRQQLRRRLQELS